MAKLKIGRILLSSFVLAAASSGSFAQVSIGGGTVGAELRNNGFDCVVWSTLCDTAHMPNEFCVVENLVRDAQTLAVLFGE